MKKKQYNLHKGLKMKVFFSMALSLIILGFTSLVSQAGVNLKNGNFYVTYTYLIVPGTGSSLEISSTYNSKSIEDGWFGFGRGSLFETKLTKAPDGCVVVYEYGAGGTTRFCPKTAVDPKSAAQKVVAAMKTKSPLTGKAESDLLDRLIKNAELRNSMARRYNVAATIPAGSTLYSNERGIQEIAVTKDGFIRTYNEGKKDHFNQDGKLTKIVDKNNYVIDFVYEKNQLKSIRDSFSKQVFFTWYSNGKVKELWSAGDKKAVFKYDDKNNLIYSKDVDNNAYGFSYDNNHNLTKISYNPDRKASEKEVFMAMQYDPKTSFVTQVIDRNGEKTDYKYDADPKNPQDHYWTEVTKLGFNNKPNTNRYEYEIKTRPDGSRYTYRILTIVNGIKTDSIYTECCGLPQKIARGNNVTNFEYNDKGLLTKKTSTRGEFVQINYDKVHNKISKVVNNSGTTEFEYDGKGNLKLAKNSAGKAILLIYDSKGKISKMVDRDTKTNDKRTLNFKYNTLGKPVEIEMENVGKIQVAYDNVGEIKRVDSKQGTSMALQVTEAFQNLIAIVKPAGVNLNM